MALYPPDQFHDMIAKNGEGWEANSIPFVSEEVIN